MEIGKDRIQGYLKANKIYAHLLVICAHLLVRGQPGKQSEFQDNQSYTEKLGLEESKQQQENLGLSAFNHEIGIVNRTLFLIAEPLAFTKL